MARTTAFRSRAVIRAVLWAAQRCLASRSRAGEQSKWLDLDTTGAWIGPNFKEGNYKNNRRLLFFPEADVGTWSDLAVTDPDPFADGKERAAAKKKKKPPQA